MPATAHLLRLNGARVLSHTRPLRLSFLPHSEIDHKLPPVGPPLTPAPVYAMLTTPHAPLDAAQAGSVPHRLSRCRILSEWHARAEHADRVPTLAVPRTSTSSNPKLLTHMPQHVAWYGNLLDIIQSLRLGNATCWRMQTSSVGFIRHTAGALHRSIGPIAINAIRNAPCARASAAAHACFLIQLCDGMSSMPETAALQNLPMHFFLPCVQQQLSLHSFHATPRRQRPQSRQATFA
jgi:hypothetical protein